MKVIIICKEPIPSGMAATQRIFCFAKSLLLQGIECTVVTFRRNETGKVRINMNSEGMFEGIPFLYTGGSTRKPSHKIPRILSELYDMSALRKYLSHTILPGDVVIGFLNGEVDFMRGIIDLVHNKGAKFVKELCEMPFFGSQTKKDKARLEKTLSVLFPKYDGFITISDTLTELAEKHKNPQAKLIRLPILVEYDKVSEPVPKKNVSVPYLFHAGTLYEQKDGIVGMLEAFDLARRKLSFPIKLIMTGDPRKSPDQIVIEKTIAEHDMSGCVEFTGYLCQDRINEYLSGSSFAVINKHDNIQNTHCFPTKLASYLAAGKAVIITDVGEAMNWLKNGETAWIVRREDTAAMADAIVYAFEHKDECRRIGENGRKLCKECFDYRSVSEKFAEFIRNI